MGDTMNFLTIVIICAAFTLFATQLFTYSVTQSGTASEDYPLITHSQQYQAQTANFTNEMMNMTQSSQQTDPSLIIGTESINAGTALAKTMTFMFSSLNIAYQMLGDAFFTLAGTFGVPAWVLMTIVAIISTFILLTLIGILLRWWL